jgi:hypothetical protein
VLKKLEKKGYLSRQRVKDDERNLCISITEEGEALQERAVTIPKQISKCVDLKPEEARELYRLLYQILEQMK